MKKFLMFAVAVLTALTVTMSPKQAVAANAVGEVAKVLLVVGLLAYEIDQMNKCNDGKYQYCDYYDHNHCQYQTVTRTDVITTCDTYGRYASYDCVRSQNTSTYYIKSCHGFNASYK